jgi:hypothetical protein
MITPGLPVVDVFTLPCAHHHHMLIFEVEYYGGISFTLMAMAIIPRFPTTSAAVG